MQKKRQVYHFPAEMLKKNKKEIELDDRDFLSHIATWTSYYRLYPHLFVKEYLGINLKLFQSFLIYMMMNSTYFTFIAARGLGKTFLTAIYAIVRAILFPDSLVVISSATKTQAMEMFLKIEGIYNASENFRRECIRPPTKTENMPRIIFKNGSLIRVVANSDNARGGRANVLILDESGRMDSDMIASVLRKFKASPRSPKFLSKDEYRDRQDLIEANQEISLSSATMKIDPLWQEVQGRIKGMANGESYFACGFPYQMSVKENLLLKQQVLEEMTSPEFNETIWSMEMDALFYGNTTSGFFSTDDFARSRTLAYPVYPKWAYELLDDKNFKYPKKQEGEVRLLSLDVALSNADKGDNAVLSMGRLIPKGDRYERLYSYMMTLHGADASDLVLTTKRTFYDLDCDYMVLDVKTIGIPIYDLLSKTTEDKDRGTFYDPWMSVNNPELQEREHDIGAKPIVYGIQANDRLNTTIAWNFKDHIKRGIAKFPVDKYEGTENLYKLKDFDKLTVENQAMFEAQYGQFNAMLVEMVNLQYKVNEGRGTLSFSTDGKNRKDRYSSVSYADYIADELEKDLVADSGSWNDYMFFN